MAKLTLGNDAAIQTADPFRAVDGARLRQGPAPQPTGKQLRIVRLDAIVGDSPIQTRGPFDPEHDEEDRLLAESLREEGQRLPVELALNPGSSPTTYTLVYGHRRVAALRWLGRETVEALVVAEAGDLECHLATLIENIRKAPSPLKQANAISVLRSTLGLAVEEIAQRIGLTRQHVYRLLDLLTVDESLQEVLERREVASVKTIRALGQAPREHQPRLAELAAAHEWTEDEAKKTVDYMQATGTTPDEAAVRLDLLGLTLPTMGNGDHVESTTDQAGDADGPPNAAAPPSPNGAGRRSRRRRGDEPVTSESAPEIMERTAWRLNAQTKRKVADAAVRRGIDARGLQVTTLLAFSGKCPMPKALERAEAVKDHPTVKSALAMVVEIGRLRESYQRGLTVPETGMCLAAALKALQDLLLMDSTAQHLDGAE